MDEEGFVEAQTKSVPQNTKRNTDWSTKVFKDYCLENDINVDFQTVTESELADVLKKFYSSVRKKSGELYGSSALVCIRSAIHRTLTTHPYSRSINILHGDNFNIANRIFNAKFKVYKKRDACQNPKSKQNQITNADMQKLGMYFQDFKLNPKKLLEFVWFSVCYYLKRRGRGDLRELKATSYILKTDEEGHEYLSERMPLLTKTTNHEDGPCVVDGGYPHLKIYDKTFLEAYKLYMKKRCNDNDAFFQTPKPNVSPSEDVWYKNEAMGKNKLGSIMNDLSKSAKLSCVYTPFSIRASMISILFRAGIQPKQICELTKHKHENSLNSYITTSRSSHRSALLVMVRIVFFNLWLFSLFCELKAETFCRKTLDY